MCWFGVYGHLMHSDGNYYFIIIHYAVWAADLIFIERGII